ncbi:unnamed protein product [Coffea canephora]|uniref:Uncharacterized protein n=1 Tax=Coffea canephora TaxID=49390 RepID=A0A068V4N8_COFCA|nr:unnamed protein product [Coffea canephora]
MTKLIPRNSGIPIKKSQVFTTYQDQQTTVSIKVYQGERSLTKDCYELGKFDLSGIPPAPRGVPQIEVTFGVDANGILQVTAMDKAAKKSNSITITNEKGHLTAEEIDRMDALEWLDGNQNAEKLDYDEKMAGLEAAFNPIIRKANESSAGSSADPEDESNYEL